MTKSLLQETAGYENISQLRIFLTLSSIENLPKTRVRRNDDYSLIEIFNENQFVPDFTFNWISSKGYYRVYILLAEPGVEKTTCGYAICTIGTSYAAMGFGVLYGFLHKHRANNKSN